ncbi:hypothetical protein K2173_023748 [Erythroxylum novogranatense]|uniref:DUF4283 domain-containing protein n=1 Tax=Erythroxylum novogranatense TaxID=1862640 RepID=A0AAV8TRZ2_9ROSI|nr:hypothetical protein K2173_023748 [Erythroxylum novogranatense]
MNTAADACQPLPAGIGVDATTKKVKNKDADSVDSDDVMKEAVVVSPFVSFRDKLLGESSTHSATIPLEEEDEISIGEEDYIATVENGVPSITFSDRINGLLDKRMELCVIIKLLGRRITYNRTKQHFHLSTLENDYCMAKFQSKEDYVMVLFEGPWLVFGHCLTIQLLTPTFDTIEPYPMDVSTWIRLLGLPSRMYVHEALTAIDKQVGKRPPKHGLLVLRSASTYGKRYHPKSKSMAGFKELNTSRCHFYVLNAGAVQVEKGKSPMLRTQVTLEELVKWVEPEEYGSWMVVKRKPRVITNPGNNQKCDDTGAKFKGSRFDLLAGQEENELAMDNLGKDAAPNDSSPTATRINNIRKEQTGSTSNRQDRKNANEPVSEAQKQANTVGSIRKGLTVTNFKKVADEVA